MNAHQLIANFSGKHVFAVRAKSTRRRHKCETEQDCFSTAHGDENNDHETEWYATEAEARAAFELDVLGDFGQVYCTHLEKFLVDLDGEIDDESEKELGVRGGWC